MNNWWKDAIIYQIYPRSFMDTNGDGIGDIKGIISKLDYLKELGIDVIWLSPVYCSPNDDFGYDISDYYNINPEFGSMQDMDRLISEVKSYGIRIVMDLVINHTSDEHSWFIQSRDKMSPYRDYYFWREGKNGKEPNNWTSFFGEKAWQKDELSGEYYLHLFSKKQPDLNYHNPEVLKEIKNIMRFWLDKGISGFRCDVINIIWKSSLEDGKPQFILTGKEHYLSQEGTHEILKELRREVLSNYDCFSVGETVFVSPKMAFDLCDESRGELDMIFSFEHMECEQFLVKWFKTKFKPKRFFETLSKWQNELSWNALYLENHDQPRSVSRFGDAVNYATESAKLLAMLLLTLKGTPYIFQGQELGMTNFDIQNMEQIADIESHNIYKLARRLGFSKKHAWKMIAATSRDNARTPMQWDNSKNAGFSKGNPWLKVNSNFEITNAKAQQKDDNSVFNFYKKLITLRKVTEVLRKGDYKAIKISKSVFVYERSLSTLNRLIIMINLSGKKDFHPQTGTVLLSNYGRTLYDNVLLPYEGIIISP